MLDHRDRLSMAGGIQDTRATRQILSFMCRQEMPGKLPHRRKKSQGIV